MSTPRTPQRKTLWEEGRHRGRLVTSASVLVTAALVALDLGVTHGIGWVYDIGFVLLCMAAALLVRPHDFFGIGVLPPLLMAAVVLVLDVANRTAVASARDGLVQGFVSGLAHHAGSLATGYGLTLVLLAVRQVALRNAGTLRTHRPTSAPRVAPRSTSATGRLPAPEYDETPSDQWVPAPRSAPAAERIDRDEESDAGAGRPAVRRSASGGR